MEKAEAQLRDHPPGRRRGRLSLRGQLALARHGLDAIPADGMILDVGPQSIVADNSAIDDAKTLVWNGPARSKSTPFDRAPW